MKSPRLWKALAFAGAAIWAGRVLARRRRFFDLADRVVIITGASRGLGLELARQFAASGARVCMLARSAGDLQAAYRKVREAAPDAPEPRIWACDVTDAVAVSTAIADVAREFERIDVLVNNAGTIQVGPARHMRPSDFERALATHLWGPLYAMDAVIPRMRAQGFGRIVNISSIGGKVAAPHMAPYTASKHALVGLSDGLRAELEREGIRVTTVCPGLMRTGSHWNVEVRGRHEAEFAWFAIADGLPGLSTSVRRAARKIIRACQYGDRQRIIGLPARLAVVASALAPELFADLVAALEHLALPAPAAGSTPSRSGWQSRSRWAPSWWTRAADRAVEENNELAGHSPAELRPKLH